jgi:serine/threonine-protein kinase SRPK3
MQKLGWGHFSTVWLSKDLKYSTYVAIKIQKSAQHYLEAAYDEVEILQELEKHNYDPEWEDSVKDYWQNQPERITKGIERDHSQVVQLLNSFIHHGPNGKHFCMVFEIMGVTLLEIIKRYNYKGIPIPYVRMIAKQILIGLDYLHRMCGIIHTDLKPENVLVCLTQEELVY